MNPVLLQLYGPLKIHAYGICIALGVLIAFYLFSHDKKVKKLLSIDQMITIAQLIFVGAYLGGKIILMLSEADKTDFLFIFKFWEPGLSILGGIIGATIALCTYIYIRNIPLLQLIDRIALYIPLTQSFGRLGCFFAGCCYGIPTNAWYAVTYTHENHLAPLNCSLHPAQLYSSVILFGIFLFIYFVQQHRTLKAGIIACSYLILTSIERFMIDFIRWDRVFFSTPGILQLFSVYQWIAVAICVSASIVLFILNNRQT